MNTSRGCGVATLMNFTLTLALTMTVCRFPAQVAVAGESGEDRVDDRRREWKPVGSVDPAVLREASGLEASSYPGVFWAHGDSGTAPRIVAFDVTGKILAQVDIAGAPNTDWEDICADDQGHIYIGDIGNNTGMFPARYVYQIREPDPFNPPAEPVSFVKRWRFKYTGVERFDCESLFWYSGSLYLITNSTPKETVIYRLDEHEAGELVLTPAATPDVFYATGADASGERSQLLACSYHALWLFPLTGGANLIDSAQRRTVNFPSDDSIEGCCFSGSDIFLLSETGKLFRVSESDLADKERFIRSKSADN